MNKLNELKNLRTSSAKDSYDGDEHDNVNYHNKNNNLMNSSHNSMNMSQSKNYNPNKTNSRIEIDATAENDENEKNEKNHIYKRKHPHNNNQDSNDDEEDQNELNDKVDLHHNQNQNQTKNLTNSNKKSNDKKTFLTENQLLNFDNKELFTFHDMIVPGGKNAKLCMVNDPFNKNLRVTEIADHFKFYEPTPTIVLIGANTKRKGKLFAGLTRAALNTRAVIIDSGLQTGAEKFCIRKNINLIGIAPESMIEYPKPNPDKFSNKMLTSGHTHFMLLNNPKGGLKWGDESKFKLSLAERLANGRKGFSYKSKVVGVILGNIPNCEEEIIYCIEKNWPLILIEDSDLSQLIKTIRNGEEIDDLDMKDEIDDLNSVTNLGNEKDNKIKKKSLINKIAKYSKVIEIEDDSETLASAVHLCLTISF